MYLSSQVQAMRDHRNTPIHIGDICLKNPFAIYAQIPANTKTSGKISTDTLAFIREQSQRESSLVIVGPASMTTPQNPKKPLIRADQPKYVDSLRAIAKVIESKGPLAGIQVEDEREAIEQNKWTQSLISTLERLRESGFKVLELSISPNHQEWLSPALTKKIIKKIGERESILVLDGKGLAQGVMQNFIRSGGHMISFEQKKPDLPKENLIKKLSNWPNPSQIVEDLKVAELIGIPGKPLGPK